MLTEIGNLARKNHGIAQLDLELLGRSEELGLEVVVLTSSSVTPEVTEMVDLISTEMRYSRRRRLRRVQIARDLVLAVLRRRVEIRRERREVVLSEYVPVLVGDLERLLRGE